MKLVDRALHLVQHSIHLAQQMVQGPTVFCTCCAACRHQSSVAATAAAAASASQHQLLRSSPGPAAAGASIWLLKAAAAGVAAAAEVTQPLQPCHRQQGAGIIQRLSPWPLLLAPAGAALSGPVCLPAVGSRCKGSGACIAARLLLLPLLLLGTAAGLPTCGVRHWRLIAA